MITERVPARQRYNDPIVVRYPEPVKAALRRAAAKEYCSISDIARRAMIRGLREQGLLDEPMA